MDTKSKQRDVKNTNQDWTEKYRPNTLSNVVGNKEATRELKSWASEWVSGKPTSKAVILAGKPGIGKTTSAIALARDMGWEVLEMNASDQRNRDAIKAFVGRSAVDDTFSRSGDFTPYNEGKRTLLILDEADNIFGTEDKGGIHEITKTIKRTEQPIVLIANDYYDLTRRSNMLKKLCKKIDFEPIQKEKIIALLKEICENEGIGYEIGALRAIAERAEGDVRSGVRDLESLALGSKERLRSRDVDALGSREQKAEIFPTLKKILQNKDPLEAKESIKDLDEEPSDLLVWIDENLPREYDDARELLEGYRWLSRADVYLGRVRRRQWYRAWVYAGDTMTAGVCSAKNRPHRGWTKYAFPTWIRKMSGSKETRNIKHRISRKVAPNVHSTSSKVNFGFLPFLKILFKKDIDIREKFVDEWELNPEEAAFLVGSEPELEIIQDLFSKSEDEAEEKEREGAEKKAREREEEKEREEEEEEEDEKQRSLLEF
ncbi:MAG: replication factor C large subunit [Candidatus Thermoplasmatota archaeon]